MRDVLGRRWQSGVSPFAGRLWFAWVSAFRSANVMITG
jgi:hypothetical protein